MREHYVRTVDVWYETFEKNWAQVVDLVGEEVARVWHQMTVNVTLGVTFTVICVSRSLSARPWSAASTTRG